MNDDDVPRRRVLIGSTVGVLTGLAGCSDASGDDPPSDEDDTDDMSDVSSGDSIDFKVDTFTVTPTETAGELQYELDVSGESDEIATVHLASRDKEQKYDVNALNFTDTGSIDGISAELNTVSATIETVTGSERTVQADGYARGFDHYDGDKDVEFPPHYLLFWSTRHGHPQFEETPTTDHPVAAVGEPEMEWYSQQTVDFNDHNREAFERHFDQMLGHGISRVQFNLGEDDAERDRFRMYWEELDLFDEIEVEFSHPIIQAFRRERDIFADYELMSEFFAEANNVATIDERPVVYFWGFAGLYTEDGIHARIVDEYGSLSKLTDEIRDALTVNGTSPFLIFDIGSLGESWSEHGAPENDLADAVLKCDGVSHWSPDMREGDRKDTEQYFGESKTLITTTREFADQYDLDYVPFISPGFDDRDNNVWGNDRYGERDPEMFAEIAELGVEYSTVDVVYICTWNDWAEGTTIEPGTYPDEDEDYGTRYLELLKDRV